MEPISLIYGVCVGVFLGFWGGLLIGRSGRSALPALPRESPGEPALPLEPDSQPAPPSEAPSPPAQPEPEPTPELPPTPPAPTIPDPPELSLVAYHCPQCGANVEIPDGESRVTCVWCDVSLRIEGRGVFRPVLPERRRADRSRPPAYVPPGNATMATRVTGRFEASVLRQPLYEEDPRESLRWMAISPHRTGILLIRVLVDGAPVASADLLAALGRPAAATLAERSDPGLAVKAALRVLSEAGPEDAELEMFCAIFDSERSTVTFVNAGCKTALIHCSREEGRPIDAARSSSPLKPVDLTANPDRLANQAPLQLATGDVVVLTSAAVAGRGRGWSGGQRVAFETLRKSWTKRTPGELATTILDHYWRDRDDPKKPVGDLFVVALGVAGNRALLAAASDAPSLPGPALPAASAAILEHETAAFTIAISHSASARTEVCELHSRRHALILAEGLTEEGDDEAWTRLVRRVRFVLDGETGDNENPRRAGREALGLAGVEDRPVSLLVVMLGDEHGKIAFFTKGWGPAVALDPRGDRGAASLQCFDGGGEAWPRPGGRLLLPGRLVLGKGPKGLPAIAAKWPGGKASALYETCRDHEDHATARPLLEALREAVAIDRAAGSLARSAGESGEASDEPGEAFSGLAIIDRRPE